MTKSRHRRRQVQSAVAAQATRFVLPSEQLTGGTVDLITARLMRTAGDEGGGGFSHAAAGNGKRVDGDQGRGPSAVERIETHATRWACV